MPYMGHGIKGASFVTIVKLADIFSVDISEFFKPVKETSALSFSPDSEELAGWQLLFLREQITEWTDNAGKDTAKGEDGESE
jgi:hypothetical protein